MRGNCSGFPPGSVFGLSTEVDRCLQGQGKRLTVSGAVPNNGISMARSLKSSSPQIQKKSQPKRASARSGAASTEPDDARVAGVIGLGLMGRDIACCLIAHGYRVIGYNRNAERAAGAVAHIDHALKEMVRHRVLSRDAIKDWKNRFFLADSLAALAPCSFVIETVKEDLALKREIYDELEQHVAASTVVASNTSSIPISVLQQGRTRPERFIGMHWGEPAQIMRYLEVIPGKQTSRKAIKATLELAQSCSKEPTLLKEDIRGFLSNRMMYAMLREAFHLVESGIADVETVDRSFRNDIGWWATLAGPFRWMDLTGIPAYATVMEGLLPELSPKTEVPELMKRMVARGARGISNQKGFYRYSKEESAEWEKRWVEFTYEVKKLADRFTPVETQ